MAIDYLSGAGVYADRMRYPMPEVMLLDLKMPRLNGFDVLHWLADQSFPGLQVIVLSSSLLPEDIAKTLAMGADHYLIKGEPEKTAQSIETFLGAQGLDLRHHHSPFLARVGGDPAKGLLDRPCDDLDADLLFGVELQS